MDVDSWLRELGLGHYAGLFRENDIDGALLRRLTSDDLKELGVASLGHRRRLLDAIATLAAAPSSAAIVTDPHRHAERRQLTVMFVDLVGSTALSARLDPEVMRDILRVYQNTVAGEIARMEGHVAKFMGDGVLAYFGWPRAHEDEAERAVRAGLAIVAAVARTPAAAEPLACRVGIATGLVVVGDLVGEGSAAEAAVVGETPNLAARLQAVAEPGQVVIAEVTRQLAGEHFLFRALPSQELRGLPGRPQAYLVEGERVATSRFAARQGGALTPIVGREQELALLLERWRQAQTCDGQLVLLTGEAGIGKSRIVEALVEAVAATPHSIVRFQCTPYHTDSALHPATQYLEQSLGAGDGGSPARVERFLHAAGLAVVEPVALICDLLGTATERDRAALAHLTPQQRRTRTLSALTEYLTTLAARQPLLWVVEDAHWIDPTTLELIELALDQIQGRPMLALVTARPNFSAGFASHPIVSRLTLNRLARAATGAIVDRITGGKPLPEAVLAEITARTDGVPLFVEEMTKAVLESGALAESRDGYRLEDRSGALAIPTTLHDSLMARLDRLPTIKEVAQVAAVIGRAFDHPTIAALSGLEPDRLAEAMGHLVEAELVFRRGTPPDATYLFKHALVRDAAYESLLKSKRAAMHARLADILSARGDAAPEVTARHAEAAGRIRQALDLWQEAGARALARPAYREAIASFENAIRLCHDMGDGLEERRREQGIRLQLGQALIANQGYQATDTLQAFARALELADGIGEVGLQLPALFGLWAGQHIAGTGSAALADRYAALAETHADAGARLIGLRMIGLERFYAGRFRDSLAITTAGLELYDPAVHHDLMHRFGHDPRAASANYRAWSLWHLGHADEAERTMQENLRWIRTLDHANTTGLVLCFGTMTYIWLRRPAQVLAAAREAIALAEEMTLPLWHAWGRIQLGWALAQEEAAAGIDEMVAGIEEARRIGAGRFAPFHLGLLADAQIRAGRPGEAELALGSAFAKLAEGHHQAFAAELHRVRAGLHLHASGSQGRLAETELVRALALAHEQEAPALALRAAHDLARLLAARGERHQALDLLAPIRARFSEGFATADLIETDELLRTLA